MGKRDGYNNSILIVSGSEQFTALVKRSVEGFIVIDCVKSASMARRRMLEHSYDIIVISIPLSDEPGGMLAADAASDGNSSVLAAVPQEYYTDALERFTDSGILVISKSMSKGILDKAIRFLSAVQRRIGREKKKTQTVEEKMAELRIVSKAKLILIETKHMTEDEAHRYIGKLAMDNGISRRAAAESLLE